MTHINADHQEVWPVKLDLPTAASAMRKALDVKGNGYVYQMPLENPECCYAETKGGPPSCAVGYLVYDVAGDQPVWSEISGPYRTEAISTVIGDGLIDADEDTKAALEWLQQCQDSGYTWLEAASLLLAIAEGRPTSVIGWWLVDIERATPRFSTAEAWRDAGHTMQELEASALLAMVKSGEARWVLDPKSKPTKPSEILEPAAV
jgi:hypothetical protein